MMKTLKLIIFTLLFSVTTYVNAQEAKSTDELDKTIENLIPKAKKNKLSEKQLQSFTTAYHEANEIDHKCIMRLKESGQADIWIEIYHRLTSIEQRQNKVNALPDNIKSAMNFRLLKLENEINNSRGKAELYLCAKANALLKTPNNENIKEAQRLIYQLIKINPQNKNIDELMVKSVILPYKHIIFRVATPIEMHLPQDIAKLILDFDDDTIYNIPFDVVQNKDTKYDLMIRIMIDQKIISPEKIETITFEETKDNFKAVVTDKTMTKSAALKGKIQIIDVKNDEILINTPYNIASTFRHQYAEVSGNTQACTEYTLQLLNNEVIDFPTDDALLKGAARELNSAIKNIFQKN